MPPVILQVCLPRTYLLTYLCDSSYCRDSSNRSDHSDQKTFFTKKMFSPENFCSLKIPFSHKKSHNQKITQPLYTQKITQYLKKNQITSAKKSHNLQKNKSCNPSEWVRKITQPLLTQNYATSQQMKSRNLSTKKIMQPLYKKSCKLSTKKIAPKKSSNLRKKKSGNLQKNKSCNLSDWVRKITQPLNTQKSRNLSTHKITQPL